MAFVGQTANPWDVPDKQAAVVMQKIWDTTSRHKHEILGSSVVYQKVRDCVSFRTILKHILDYSTPFGLMAQSHWINWSLSRLGIL
jgi:hypothetical protein